MSAPVHSVKDAILAELGQPASGALLLGGLDATALADQFGTPAYVYDASVLRRKVASLKQALGDRLNILFALKANPNIAIARLLREAGVGCEVASAGEIVAAVAAGFRGDEMQFAGPGKHGLDLTLSLKHDLSSLNVESPAEYAAIAALARATGARPKLSIRVNPQEPVSGSRMRMGGASKKFGVDQQAVPALVEQLQRDDVCEFRGLHVYAGTQSFDVDAWLSNARGLFETAAALERDTGVKVKSLNFGGGLGVPLFDGDRPLDLARLGRAMQQLIAQDARPDRQYFVELGRYIAAESGVFLTRVVYLKTSGDRTHAILDGGMHQHSAAAGVGSVIRRPFPIAVARAPRAEPDHKYTLGGPLCTPADEFASDLSLPELRQGDVVAILASGAYGLTFSNVLFLSHPSPCEVLIDAGRAHVVRDAGRPEDLLRGQHLVASRT